MSETKQKKPTNAQLQKRIANAIVHIDRTKDTISMYFDDKGLRLIANEDYALIETGYHYHIFTNVTNDGVSRPYLYTKRMIEIAIENEKDCFVDDGHSFKRLLQVLKAKEDQNDYNVAAYFEWYLMNIFCPLYSIGETDAQAFSVYMDYIHNIAKNTIFLDEHKDGLTNRQFIDKWIDHLKEFTKDIEERLIFLPKTDEQLMQENIQALQEQENEQFMQEQIKNEESKEND